MVDIAYVRMFVQSLPEANEQPHFEKISFRYKKKIFATYSDSDKRLVVKLALNDQSTFCNYDKTVFSPVPGAWGKKGWMAVDMRKVRKDMAKDILKLSYDLAAGH